MLCYAIGCEHDGDRPYRAQTIVSLTTRSLFPAPGLFCTFSGIRILYCAEYCAEEYCMYSALGVMEHVGQPATLSECPTHLSSHSDRDDHGDGHDGHVDDHDYDHDGGHDDSHDGHDIL